MDVSGTTSGQKLVACSIAAVVLIGKLGAEEVAIALFESNTHALKELSNGKSIDDVAGELLDLKSTGGTQVTHALEWGSKQLELVNAGTRICFLLTYCEFFGKSSKFQRLPEPFSRQHVKFILAVNTRSHNNHMSKKVIEVTNDHLVKIFRRDDIPSTLSRVLEQLG